MNASETIKFVAPFVMSDTDMEIVKRFVNYFSGPFEVKTKILRCAMYEITDTVTRQCVNVNRKF